MRSTSVDLPLSRLYDLLDAANLARAEIRTAERRTDPSTGEAEQRLQALFDISNRLAVYGTLAPGEPNHHIVAPLAGEWTEGLVEGDLMPVGWGATLGYPAFRPQVGGTAVRVQVLTAPALTQAWSEIDRFEGPEYRRILVAVFKADRSDERHLFTVANLYAAA